MAKGIAFMPLSLYALKDMKIFIVKVIGYNYTHQVLELKWKEYSIQNKIDHILNLINKRHEKF
jgi:hypothetical protein